MSLPTSLIPPDPGRNMQSAGSNGPEFLERHDGSRPATPLLSSGQYTTVNHNSTIAFKVPRIPSPSTLSYSRDHRSVYEAPRRRTEHLPLSRSTHGTSQSVLPGPWSTIAPSSGIHRSDCFSTSSKHYSPCTRSRKHCACRRVKPLLRVNYQRG